MQEYIIKVTTTGSAGSAAGSASTESTVTGFIEAVQFDFHASAPATTDTTVTEASAPARTLIALTNTATDAVKYPRAQVHDTAGAAITGVYDRFLVVGTKITCSLSQCDALTNALVARIYVSER